VRKRTYLAAAITIAAAGILVAVAAARSAAVPGNTAAPTISGDAKEGSTLTTTDGTWTNSPTSFAYKWQRCASDGTACADISGATSKTYTLVTGDVGHTDRVVVTASNADGKTSAPSAPTDVIGSKNGPTLAVKPLVTGNATVGGQLITTNGTWAPLPTSYSYQWQRCNDVGESCLNVAGATGKSYGVRSADVGHRMRALVTAHVSSERSTAPSTASALVSSNTQTVTTTSTTTVRGNQPPSITFLSLKRTGRVVYVRFRVCDDGFGTITVTARESKNRALAASHRFSVRRSTSCGVFTRSWTRAARFSISGRYVVSLRAEDTSHALSRLVSRSLAR